MDTNDSLFERARQSIPGGVNSPVRAFGSVGGAPRFMKKAQGPYMWDEDGKRYIDYIGSWGPMILGHNNPEVIRAVHEAVDMGLTFGCATKQEILIAEEIKKIIPSIEEVRLVSSGTEAGMSAIRLARGYTGRNKIIKFEGCYHGHSDSLLVKAGSGMLTFGNPSSAGVPAGVTEHTLVLEYNNCAQLKDAFERYGSDIACVIVEAVAGNMNMVPGKPEFIHTMRELCTRYGALLIVDEVMTGFRVALKGAQSLYGVTPDITMFGKVIGGGMPVAAFGGRRDVMEKIAPCGPVYQAGTLSGNPVAVACGLTTLKLIQAPGFYDKLALQTKKLVDGLCAAAKEAGVPFSAQSVGGMFGLYFLDKCPEGFSDVMKSDTKRFNVFFHSMLDQGVYFAPSVFEAGFVSITHTDEVIEETIRAAKTAFAKEAVKPANLYGKRDVYGVSLCTRRLGSILSNRAVMFVAPSEVALTIQATPAETERLLAGVPDAGRIEIQGEEEGRTSVLLHAGTEDLYRLCGDIFLACAENNAVLLELTPRRASLEDVFLELNAGQPEAPAADEDKEAMS